VRSSCQLSLSLSHQFLCLHTRAFGARVCVCTCHPSIPFPVPVGGLIVRESTHTHARVLRFWRSVCDRWEMKSRDRHMGVSIHPRPSRSKKEKDSDQKPASQPASQPRHATPRHTTAPVRKNKHTSLTNAREQINKTHLTRVFDEKESPACLACAAEAFLFPEAAVSLFSIRWADGGGVGGVSSYSSRSLYLLLLRKGEQDLVLLSGAAAVSSVILYFF
jgi:hypothetical protein